RVAGKKSLLDFSSKNNNNKESGFSKARDKKYNSSSSYNSKKRKNTQRKSFWIFGGNKKHDRKGDSYDRKKINTKGSYEYNSKSKNVKQKKSFFIFKKYKHEKETSFFKGDKSMKIFKFNRKTGRKEMRKNRIKKSSNKHGVERELFAPNMRTKR
ncbi:MAG: hypothetical protein HGB12_08195, partial [Bacteroidetes bacterium]|nr:hypothetical protein [Bacteroidota bacterium]